MFQHTATRRWLHPNVIRKETTAPVSTHSHPKVAAIELERIYAYLKVSTHSHPKVAALASVCGKALNEWFQHTATRSGD